MICRRNDPAGDVIRPGQVIWNACPAETCPS
jgi:hypothetical protein